MLPASLFTLSRAACFSFCKPSKLAFWSAKAFLLAYPVIINKLSFILSKIIGTSLAYVWVKIEPIANKIPYNPPNPLIAPFIPFKRVEKKSFTLIKNLSFKRDE